MHNTANSHNKMKTPAVKEDISPPSVTLQTNYQFHLQVWSATCHAVTKHQLSATGSISLLRLPLAGQQRNCRVLLYLRGMSVTVQVSKHQEAKRSSLPESRAANSEDFVQRPCFTSLSPLTLMCVSLLLLSVIEVKVQPEQRCLWVKRSVYR